MFSPKKLKFFLTNRNDKEYRPQPEPTPSEKTDPGPLEKSGSYTKIHFMSQRLMVDKFQGADFKYDCSF